MNKIKTELNNLQEPDIFNLLLFALYQGKNIPEYNGLCELAYILDKDNLLKLCEFFGGLTITIPTIQEIEILLQGLLLYQKIDIEHKDADKECYRVGRSYEETKQILTAYANLKELLSKYNFNSRG